jgi:hypothetical protein
MDDSPLRASGPRLTGTARCACLPRGSAGRDPHDRWCGSPDLAPQGSRADSIGSFFSEVQ